MATGAPKFGERRSEYVVHGLAPASARLRPIKVIGFPRFAGPVKGQVPTASMPLQHINAETGSKFFKACMIRVVADHALKPKREGVRVMEILCGSGEPFGGPSSVQINPFIRRSELVWPLDRPRADYLAEHGLALSLSEALKRKLKCDDVLAILEYFHALVQLSDVAKGKTVLVQG